MDSELMFPPGSRMQPEKSGPFSQFEQFNCGECIRRTFNDSLPKPGFARFHSVLHAPMVLGWPIHDASDRKVLALDHPLRKQPVITAANCRLNGKQKEPGGVVIQPVHRG